MSPVDVARRSAADIFRVIVAGLLVRRRPATIGALVLSLSLAILVLLLVIVGVIIAVIMLLMGC